jgi:hypothetical protein
VHGHTQKKPDHEDDNNKVLNEAGRKVLRLPVLHAVGFILAFPGHAILIEQVNVVACKCYRLLEFRVLRK